MRRNTAVLLALSVLLTVAVGLTMRSRSGLPNEASLSASRRFTDELLMDRRYLLATAIRAGIPDIEGLAYEVPWCPAPVLAFYIPTYLSALDMETLLERTGFRSIYFYRGRSIPGRHLDFYVAGVRYLSFLGSVADLHSRSGPEDYLTKVFVKAICFASFEKQSRFKLQP